MIPVSIRQTFGTAATLAFITAMLAPAASGAITGSSIELPDLRAGATNTIYLNFSTDQPINNTDQINVTFPADFDIAGVDNNDIDVDCGNSFGGSDINVIVNGQILEIIRNGGTDNATATVRCTVADVVSPGVSGGTGPYAVNTYNRTNTTVIDGPENITESTLTPNVLGTSSIEFNDTKAGATIRAFVNFTTFNPIEANGYINTTFPAGWTVGAAGSANCNVGAGFAVTTSGQNVRIQTTAQIAGGTTSVACTVDGIVNPTVSQAGGSFDLRTNASSGAPIDQNLTITGPAVTANVLTVTALTLNTTAVGAASTVTVNFTSTNPVPTNGYLNVTFPGGWTLTSADQGTCDSGTTFATTDTGNTVRIQVTAGTIAAGARSCSFQNVTNPSTTGPSGNFEVRTTDNAPAVIDEDATVTGPTITAGALRNADITLSATTPSTTVTVTAAFNNTNAIPDNGKIKILFPAGFNVTGATGGDCTGIDGNFTTFQTGQTVQLNRTGDGNQTATGDHTCTVGGIVTPAATGTTGPYQINTTTTGDAIIDEATNIAGDTIASPSSGGGGGGGGGSSYTGPSAESDAGTEDVDQPSDQPGGTGTWQFRYTLPKTLGGRTYVEVAYPPGFALETENSTECVIESPAGLTVDAVTYPADGTVLCDLGVISTRGIGTLFAIDVTEVTNPSAGGTGTVTLAFLDWQKRDEQIVTYPFTIHGEEAPPAAPPTTPPPSEGDGHEDGTDGADGTDGTDGGTGQTGEDGADGGEGEDTPAPGFLLLGATLAMLALLRRRRP